MEEYFYYSHFDISKQKIGSGKFISYEEALEQFSRCKNMKKNDFLRFFKIQKSN